MAKAKGSGPVSMGYAAGGPVTGRVRDFMKTPNGNDTQTQAYPKSGPGEQGKDKSMKAVKPRK